MGSPQDKLWIPIAGLPVIAHTWKTFENTPAIDEIILVIRPESECQFHDLAARLGFAKTFHCVAGGAERQNSVWNGLEALSPSAQLVAIQDGARPCTPRALIEATLEEARQYGAAVAAHPVVDTVKTSHDGRRIAEHLDRNLLWAVQTPQTFRVEVIRRALQEARNQGLPVTDDTAACALIGQDVVLVNSPHPNPKFTRPADQPYLELLLESPSPDRP